jgi:hypothetical protein
MIGTIWQRSTVWLLASAAGRLRESRPDWADAMLAEADFCESGRDRFGWAWGCWVASLRTSGWDALTYPLALSPSQTMRG